MANAKNLISVVSKALYHTRSALIRVAKETREELGLTHMMVVETDPIAGKLNQYHEVSITCSSCTSVTLCHLVLT